MMNDIQIFNNPEFGDVRTVMIDGEPWFVGRDVSKALGYAKPEGAIKNNVDEDDTLTEGVMDSKGRMQKTMVINESGLYSLIFGSKLEKAKKFKRWVTAEILPQLRKNGFYGAPQLPMTTQEQIKLLAQGNVELNQKVDTLTERVDKIELDLPILPLEADRITTAVKKKGVSVLGGKESAAYKNRALRQKLYNNLYGNLKYNFGGIKSYKSIKRCQTDTAIEIVEKYEPPFFLANEIDMENAQMSI